MPQGSPPPSSVVIRVHTHLAFRRGDNGPKTWPEILGLRGKVMGATLPGPPPGSFRNTGRSAFLSLLPGLYSRWWEEEGGYLAGHRQ